MEEDKVKAAAAPAYSMEVIVLGEQEDGQAAALHHCIEASQWSPVSGLSLLVSFTLSLSGKYERVGE